MSEPQIPAGTPVGTQEPPPGTDPVTGVKNPPFGGGGPADKGVGIATPPEQTEEEKKAAADKAAKDAEGMHPKNIKVPEEVLIKRPVQEQSAISTTGPTVRGDQALEIIDNLNGRAVKVSLIEGKGLTPDVDGRLIFVESNVIHDVMSVEAAKAKFAVKKDGTVLYGQRGFDDVPHNAEFDMLDIVKLIEYNQGRNTSGQ